MLRCFKPLWAQFSAGVETGKTPVLEGAELCKLFDSIPATTLRDRALIATLTYRSARINAALKMKVQHRVLRQHPI
jgi:hypothetical protein